MAFDGLYSQAAHMAGSNYQRYQTLLDNKARQAFPQEPSPSTMPFSPQHPARQTASPPFQFAHPYSYAADSPLTLSTAAADTASHPDHPSQSRHAALARDMHRFTIINRPSLTFIYHLQDRSAAKRFTPILVAAYAGGVGLVLGTAGLVWLSGQPSAS